MHAGFFLCRYRVQIFWKKVCGISAFQDVGLHSFSARGKPEGSRLFRVPAKVFGAAAFRLVGKNARAMWPASAGHFLFSGLPPRPRNKSLSTPRAPPAGAAAAAPPGSQIRGGPRLPPPPPAPHLCLRPCSLSNQRCPICWESQVDLLPQFKKSLAALWRVCVYICD